MMFVLRRVVAGMLLFAGGAFATTIYWAKIYVKIKYAPWSIIDAMVVLACALVPWVTAGIISFTKTRIQWRRHIVAGIVLFAGGIYDASLYWAAIFPKVKTADWANIDTFLLFAPLLASCVLAWGIIKLSTGQLRAEESKQA